MEDLLRPGTRNERSRETYVAQLHFVLRDRVPNAFVRGDAHDVGIVDYH